MNILLNLRPDDGVEPRHVEQIQAVSPDVEVLDLPSEGEMLEAMPDVDALFGVLTPAMLTRAPKLRWVQATSAGVDGVLFPEFTASRVTLTSAKGIVGPPPCRSRHGLAARPHSRHRHSRTQPPLEPALDHTRRLLGVRRHGPMGIVRLGGTGRDLAVRARALRDARNRRGTPSPSKSPRKSRPAGTWTGSTTCSESPTS